MPQVHCLQDPYYIDSLQTAHIFCSSPLPQGLRCAVIVNDMAELNIDAALVRGSALVQAEEQMVEMHNGCICCTLRGDLVKEISALAAQGRFDYVIIESTGIGEPMQVGTSPFYRSWDVHPGCLLAADTSLQLIPSWLLARFRTQSTTYMQQRDESGEHTCKVFAACFLFSLPGG